MASRLSSPRKAGLAGDAGSRSVSRQTLVMLPVGILFFGVVIYVLHSAGKLPHFAYGPLTGTLPRNSPLASSILGAENDSQLDTHGFREILSAMEGGLNSKDQRGLLALAGDSQRLSDATAKQISEIVREQLNEYLAAKEKIADLSERYKQETPAHLPESVVKQVSESVTTNLDSHFVNWNKQLEELKTTLSQAKAAPVPSNDGPTKTAQKQLTSVDPLEVERLLSNWTSVHNLTNDAFPRTKRSASPAEVLPAPHLQACEAVTELRESWDRRASDGSTPVWYTGDNADASVLHARPQPPWVTGADVDNLEGTRAAQAAIWEHQHPRDCRDPSHKFLVVNWWVPQGHGIGSQLHGWSVFYAVAKTYNRILIMTDSFVRADHEGCKGPGHKSSLGCYFMPPEDPLCKEVAMKAMQEQQRAGFSQPIHLQLNSRPEIDAVLRRSTARVLTFGDVLEQATSFWDLVPNGPWGEPWKSLSTITEEVEGKMFNSGEATNKMRWWRAQATSYLLRFPTQYLCSLCNQERNRVYGRKVAVELLEAKQRQLQVSTEDDSTRDLLVGELEHTVWSPASGAAPYIPRPILSIHVRQGDKGREMRLFDFGSYMAQAERIRRHDPSVKTIWLSTEMQSVVDDTRLYPAWEFLYTNTSRILGTDQIPDARENVDHAFVNLLLSAEADYFVGALGSNWNRLIDELRKTLMGRRRAGHISFNIAE